MFSCRFPLASHVHEAALPQPVQAADHTIE
jgi:hypothetical protein